LAGVHAVVRWQVSHEAEVGVCPEFLPLALAPLWQVLQVPGATLLWLKVAGDHALVRWQVSQLAAVGIWFTALMDAPIRLPETWQELQSRGVPLKTPCAWQDSQRARRWAPDRANPVEEWLIGFKRDGLRPSSGVAASAAAHPNTSTKPANQ